MATLNKALEKLTDQDIQKISEYYLRGWRDLLPKYGFRLKGLNHKRRDQNLPELTTELSDTYRLNYIKENYSDKEILDIITKCFQKNRVSEARYNKGIEIFNCRFGAEYARLFKTLIGSKAYRELAEKCRVQKLSETQISKYGGVGLGGKITQMKAAKTKSENKKQFLQKAVKELEENNCILQSFTNSSIFEIFVYFELLKKFSADDILIDYGVHPYDSRYPYNCDFYIKSLDLFIELNVHFTHGGHWFDENSKADKNRKSQLEQTDRVRNRKFLKTWCDTDVLKRNKARDEKLNYLVFWDGTMYHQGNVLIPNLKDFYVWVNDYNYDYEKFIKDNPNNSY